MRFRLASEGATWIPASALPPSSKAIWPPPALCPALPRALALPRQALCRARAVLMWVNRHLGFHPGSPKKLLLARRRSL